ncbi:MAG TPA: hypothetical protein VLV55_07585 [Rhizomicrobium sp.]|nr:hypothetical protein [Rhizomicrobium sp.]
MRVGILAGLMVLIAAPAFAQSCGSPPIAPAMPSADSIKKKAPAAAATAKHDAFLDIKNWQADLKNYRACVQAESSQAKTELTGTDPNKDAGKVKRLKDEIDNANHEFDSTVNSEEEVVNEFHAIQVAYCTRTDVDLATCPK